MAFTVLNIRTITRKNEEAIILLKKREQDIVHGGKTFGMMFTDYQMNYSALIYSEEQLEAFAHAIDHYKAGLFQATMDICSTVGLLNNWMNYWMKKNFHYDMSVIPNLYKPEPWLLCAKSSLRLRNIYSANVYEETYRRIRNDRKKVIKKLRSGLG